MYNPYNSSSSSSSSCSGSSDSSNCSAHSYIGQGVGVNPETVNSSFTPTVGGFVGGQPPSVPLPPAPYQQQFGRVPIGAGVQPNLGTPSFPPAQPYPTGYLPNNVLYNGYQIGQGSQPMGPPQFNAPPPPQPPSSNYPGQPY